MTVSWTEAAVWGGCAGAGLFLGLVFFWGLRLTVERAVRCRHPALVLAASFAARTGVVLAGFFVLGAGRWDRLVAALAGFFLARLLVVARARPRSRREEVGR